jgi:hypothetical protein
VTLEIDSLIPSLPTTGLSPRESVYVPVHEQQTPPARPVPKVADIRQAEDLLQKGRARQAYQQVLPDQRARRAIDAYGALEQAQQRLYVSNVLGIDEYA